MDIFDIRKEFETISCQLRLLSELEIYRQEHYDQLEVKYSEMKQNCRCDSDTVSLGYQESYQS